LRIIRFDNPERVAHNQPRKVHRDGRDVGKTAEIENFTAWASLNMPEREMLICTQRENHLFPVMERLIRLFQNNECFSACLVECKRSPSYYLRFSNGFQLWGRIAGLRGVNFQGLHVDVQLVDEAQEMTEESWGELYQSLNGDGIRWIYGVPNGVRSTFYRMSMMEDYEQHHWPSTLNPEFSDAKKRELIRLYGGESSEGYVHQVLGEHGSPASAAFDFDRYLDCIDESLEFANVEVVGNEPGVKEIIEQMPRTTRQRVGSSGGAYYMGCDLGYTRDPSELVVYRDDSKMVNVARIHLENVDYFRQQEIMVALDSHFQFAGIGIDMGNNGAAVCHNLQARSPRWNDIVEGYQFGGNIVAGFDPEGAPIRRNTKRFMTQLIEERLRKGTIVFPLLPAREEQYVSHTYRTGTHGRIVYNKGNDHIIDADRCAMLRKHLDSFELVGDSGDPGMIIEGI
ncbi:hypothetical protein ACFL1X_08375, partial [Candidatus Hydrogenedentota bacterium]